MPLPIVGEIGKLLAMATASDRVAQFFAGIDLSNPNGQKSLELGDKVMRKDVQETTKFLYVRCLGNRLAPVNVRFGT